MRSLRAGAVLLSVWSGLNLLVGAVVTAMTVMGRPPPALQLVMGDTDIRGLDARALGVVNAQATIANPCIVALCLLVLVIVWTSLVRRERWAWWALAAALLPVQAFGFVSDSYVGHHDLIANVISTIVLSVGLILSSEVISPAPAPRPQSSLQSP